MFVDAIVVDEAMMMTTDVAYDASYFSGTRLPLSQLPRPEMGPDKVIAARAAKLTRTPAACRRAGRRKP